MSGWGQALDEMEAAGWGERRPWLPGIAAGWHEYLQNYGADNQLIRMICSDDAGTEAHRLRLIEFEREHGFDLVNGDDQDQLGWCVLAGLSDSSTYQLRRHAESCRIWAAESLGIEVCSRWQSRFRCKRPTGHRGRHSVHYNPFSESPT